MIATPEPFGETVEEALRYRCLRRAGAVVFLALDG
jgi:hypothetical protein